MVLDPWMKIQGTNILSKVTQHEIQMYQMMSLITAEGKGEARNLLHLGGALLAKILVLDLNHLMGTKM